MLMWHKKGEQRMIETRKQKTQTQAHHKITESATQTHTQLLFDTLYLLVIASAFLMTTHTFPFLELFLVTALTF